MTKHSSRKQSQHPLSETHFWIQRLSKTAIRAAHILGVAISSGGFIFHLDKTLWLNWWLLAMCSGVLMMVQEIYRSKLWLIQLKGVLTFLKLGLLASIILLPQQQPNIYITVLLLSVFIAHGPAGLRHYSIWHRRVIDEPKGMRKKSLNG
ncbi:hypothetical protein CTM93_19855 [Photobacterium phosphoreum]|jgi:hypothetical protein|uniref:hypothetical protein n=1 Tax=Photobacterium phosphoreum TaxID=659 RepID=UPI000D181789|nr:hypothetical protein [Photobacterium phosphoreum]PSU75416.1 hypothetical protein CTM93_19855 [Photobacterium phosphoreum]